MLFIIFNVKQITLVDQVHLKLFLLMMKIRIFSFLYLMPIHVWVGKNTSVRHSISCNKDLKIKQTRKSRFLLCWVESRCDNVTSAVALQLRRDRAAKWGWTHYSTFNTSTRSHYFLSLCNRLKPGNLTRGLHISKHHLISQRENEIVGYTTILGSKPSSVALHQKYAILVIEMLE